MEGMSHQRLLRRQLSESLDLNETLVARIDQLKAYIWRAGLEVPRPEDGVHGPIIEREDVSTQAPAKRLRTENSRADHNDSISLAMLEASLDRSVREAFARSRSDDSHLVDKMNYSFQSDNLSAQSPNESVAVDALPKPANRIQTFESQHGNTSFERETQPNHSQHAQTQEIETYNDSNASGIDAEPEILEQPLKGKTEGKTAIEAQDKKDSKNGHIIDNQTETNRSNERSNGSHAGFSSSAVQTDSQSDGQQIPKENVSFKETSTLNLRKSQPVSPSLRSFYGDTHKPSNGKPSNDRPSNDELYAHSAPNVGSMNAASIDENSSLDAEHHTISHESQQHNGSDYDDVHHSEPQEKEAAEKPTEAFNALHNHESDNEDPEESESNQNQPDLGSNQYSEPESERLVPESLVVSENLSHNSTSDPQRIILSDQNHPNNVPSVALETERNMRSQHQHEINEVDFTSEERHDQQKSSSDGEVETFSPTNPASSYTQTSARVTNVVPEPHFNAHTEIRRTHAPKQPEEEGIPEQNVPSPHSSSAQYDADQNSRPLRPLQEFRSKEKAEAWGNESLPVLTKPDAIAAPADPSSEPRIPRRKRTEIRTDVPPLPYISQRKPRDDWAMQFRESFNSRKAQSALQRAGLPQNPELAESMKQISQKKDKPISQSQETESNALKTRSDFDSSDDEHHSPPSKQAPMLALNTVSSSSLSTSQGNGFEPGNSFSDATITPIRASRNAGSGRNANSSPSSFTANSQRKRASTPSGEERNSPSHTKPSKALPTKVSSPAPGRNNSPSASLFQQHVPSMPPVPQSILRRLSNPPNSIRDASRNSHGEPLASPFRGSVRPPMTSTPTPKIRNMNRSESAQKPSVAREFLGRTSENPSRASPNSSMYQSAMQSFDASPSDGRMEVSDSHRQHNEREAWHHRKGDDSPSLMKRQMPDDALPQPLPQPVQPLVEKPTDSSIPLKFGRRALTSEAASEGTDKPLSMPRSATHIKPMPSVANPTVTGDRRVSFKLPSSTNASQESLEVENLRPPSRRKLMRNVYPVDLSNSSQASLPDMSLQAAGDVGDISERRGRPNI